MSKKTVSKKKPGRPSLGLTGRFLIAIEPAQLRAVKAAAKKADMSAGAWMRVVFQAALGK